MKSIKKKGIIFLITVFFTALIIGGSSRIPLVDENDNFYLSNYTTFAPGDVAKLNLYSYSQSTSCLLYTSDAADERSSVDLGGRRIIKKKTNIIMRAEYRIKKQHRQYSNKLEK